MKFKLSTITNLQMNHLLGTCLYNYRIKDHDDSSVGDVSHKELKLRLFYIELGSREQ